MIESDYLHQTKIAYDLVAADYAELLRDELDRKPWDRAVLGCFAELVGGSGGGPVADLGCGPGRISGYLASLGCCCFGLDLSPAMVALARRDHPQLRFDIATLTETGLADASLAGVVAWYSVIHLPPEVLPDALAEFRRVLRPGGQLLLAFQIGDAPVHLSQGYGHELSLVAYRLQPARIAELLSHTRFDVRLSVTRAAEPPEKTDQAYLLATATAG